MLVGLISMVVWCRMSRDGKHSHDNRAPAPKSLEFFYSNIVNYQCSHCVHWSDAVSCHIHSFPMWCDFCVLFVCPRNACSSVVVLRSVVSVLQTISLPDSNDAYQLSNDPTVVFVCRNCADSPTGPSWQKRNFYFGVSRRCRSGMLTSDWLDSFAMYCSSTNQMLDSKLSSWFDCSRKFWRFA